MSVIRTKSNRADERKKQGLPYARPAWSVGNIINTLGGWGGYLLRSRRNDLTSETTSAPQNVNGSQRPNAVVSPSQDFRPSTQQSTFSESQTRSRLSTTTPVESAPVPDVNVVVSYLSEKAGVSVGVDFVDSVVNILQTSPPQSGHPFRFTFTTPGRESSPFSRANTNTSNVTPSTSPRKKLARNPNGVYRWEGAGSAKNVRSRTNRYASPAFGASPSKPERLVMKESTSLGETSGEYKRRKVGDVSSSSAQPSASEPTRPAVPFPTTASPSTPRATANPARTATASSSSRLRTPAKPTVPAVPSPLRQAWSDAFSAPSDDARKRSPSHPAKQTQTANFMAELIKETTPPTKPDLSNPYQSASPVSKIGPPRRSKRARATGRPAVPTKEEQAKEAKRKEDEEKQKEKEKIETYSSQAIIEATVPKGSKRSRPPAHLVDMLTPGSTESESDDNYHRESPVIIETKKVTYVVEEANDDAEESARSAKRSKPSVNGHGLPSSLSRKTFEPSPDSDITIEEVEDVAMDGSSKGKDKAHTNGNSTETLKLTMPTNGSVAVAANNTSSPTSRSSFSAFKSIPKEPSKLRFSFQAEGASTTPPVPQSQVPQTLRLSQSTPSAAPKTDFKFTPPNAGFTFQFKAGDKSPSQESKATNISEGKLATIDDIKSKVRVIDAQSLPTFAFTFVATEHRETREHVRARQDAKVLPPSSLPKYEFEKLVNASTATSFRFDLGAKVPPATNPSSPSPQAPINSGPVKGFDFAAAGMKVPETKKDTWSCSLCGLSNPKSTSQCETCETPAPSGIAVTPTPKPSQAPKPPVVGFNFAAAGMKAPTTTSAGKWTCSLCGLSNPNSASQCETCEMPK